MELGYLSHTHTYSTLIQWQALIHQQQEFGGSEEQNKRKYDVL